MKLLPRSCPRSLFWLLPRWLCLVREDSNCCRMRSNPLDISRLRKSHGCIFEEEKLPQNPLKLERFPPNHPKPNVTQKGIKVNMYLNSPVEQKNANSLPQFSSNHLWSSFMNMLMHLDPLALGSPGIQP